MQESTSRHYFYYAKCLETGKEISQKSSMVCESASTIKLPILVALLKEVEKGRISLRDTIHLKKDHYSKNGSGILNNFYRTQPFNVYNLALMMIILSDNIATNALIELVGQDKINSYIKNFGLIKTRLGVSRLTFPDNFSIKDIRIGETTPKEMAEFIERLMAGEFLNPTHTKIVKKYLSATQNTLFGRYLLTRSNSSSNIEIKEFGNKTGACFYDKENMQMLGDCGFLKTKKNKTIIFSVYSLGPADPNMQYSTDSSSRTDFAARSKELYEKLAK